MPQSWVLILLIKNRKKKKRRSWMLISILLLCTGTENSVDCVDDFVVDIKCSNLVDVTIEKSFDGSQDRESSECFKFPLEKVIISFLWHKVSIKMWYVVVCCNSNM